jgi:hypothetical protein
MGGYPSAASRRLGPSDEIDACLIVRDGSGRRARQVYFAEEARRAAAKLLTRAGAPRVTRPTSH